jgi:hypothetical protein
MTDAKALSSRFGKFYASYTRYPAKRCQGGCRCSLVVHHGAKRSGSGGRLRSFLSARSPTIVSHLKWLCLVLAHEPEMMRLFNSHLRGTNELF